MQNLAPVISASVATTGGGRSDEKADRWARATARYHEMRSALAPFEEAQDLAERAEIAARRVLDEMAAPESLTVEITTELYFNDGLSAPMLKRGAQRLQLRDEATICAYAKGDESLRDRLLSELSGWQLQRRKLDAAAAKTATASERASAAYSAAIRRMDAALLRVLRTPAPSGDEMRWKIEMLLKRDFNDEVEDAGWTYVAAEICRFTKPKRNLKRVLN